MNDQITAPETFERFLERTMPNKQKEKEFYYVTRKGSWFAKIIDWVYLPQHDDEDKILFEILQFTRSEGDIPTENHSEIQYRFCYYMRSKKDPNSKRYGKWNWGQHALIVPPQDLTKLLALAKEKGY